MKPRLRPLSLAVCVLWLVPVVAFFGWMGVVWLGDRPAQEDPHGYVMLFGIMLAIPAAVFGGITLWTLWSVARRRRGTGSWLMVMGILAALAAAGVLPGALVPPAGPGTPGMEPPAWPDWTLLGVGLVPLVLAIATIVLAVAIMRAERPPPRPDPRGPEPHRRVAPGR